MKRYSSIEVEIYDRISHRHRRKLADLLCVGDARSFHAEMTQALNFYGLEADYPLMLDYSVHSLAEEEFSHTPKCSQFEVGRTIFWRKGRQEGG